MKKILSVAVLPLLFVLAGCASTGSVATDTVQDDSVVRDGQTEATTGAEADARDSTRDSLQADSLDDPDSPLARRVVYFAFDSSEIRPDDMEILLAHARFLADNPEHRVVIEGHTDERGTRAYNLALGERRANAVKRVLTLNGVADSQVETVSFGEEKPVVYGQGEEIWRQNRRAEIVYSQR